MSENNQLILNLKANYDDAGIKAWRKGLNEAKEDLSKFHKGTDAFNNAGTKINYFSGKVLESNNAIKSFTQSAPSAFGSLKTSVDGLGDSFGNMISGIKGIAGVAIVLEGLKKGFELLKDFTLVSARTQVLNTVVQQVGQTAGYSSLEITKVVESVKKLGITTQEADSTVTKLIQNNISLANATKLARIAQDAGVISGENSAEALAGIIQGITTLQPEVLRHRGLMVNLQQEELNYAKANGKTIQSLTTYEKQQIALNAVLKEGEKINSVYDKSMQNPGKMLTSMVRYVEEFKNKVGAGLLPVMRELLEAFKSFLTNEKIISFFADFAKIIGSAVMDLMRLVNFITGTTIYSFGTLSAEISDTNDELLLMKDDLKILQTYQELTSTTTTKASVTQEEYKKSLQDVKEKFPGLINENENYKNILDDTITSLKNQINLKERLIAIDEKKAINETIKEYEDSKDKINELTNSLEENKKKYAELDEYHKSHLLGLNYVKAVDDATTELAKMGSPLEKLTMQWQKFILEGIRIGDVGQRMDYLNKLTQNNVQLQSVLKSSVGGLSGTFIAEYNKIAEVLVKNADLNKQWANAMSLLKQGATQDAMEEFSRIVEEAQQYITKRTGEDNGETKTKTPKTKQGKEDTPLTQSEQDIAKYEAWLEIEKKDKTLTLEKIDAYNKELKVKEEVAYQNWKANQNNKDSLKTWHDYKKVVEDSQKVIDEFEKSYIDASEKQYKEDKKRWDAEEKWKEEREKNNKDLTKEQNSFNISKTPEGDTKIDAQLKEDNRLIDEKYKAELDLLRLEPTKLAALKREIEEQKKLNKEKAVYTKQQKEDEIRTRKATAVMGLLGDAFSGFGNILTSASNKGEGFKNLLKSLLEKVLSFVQSEFLAANAVTFFKAILSGGATLPSDLTWSAIGYIALEALKGMVSGFASGGLIRGAGTGTSDSIPILASNGEFVMNARSTAMYYPQLVAMNNGSENSTNVARFSQGGYVSKNTQQPIYITANMDGLTFMKVNSPKYKGYKNSIKI